MTHRKHPGALGSSLGGAGSGSANRPMCSSVRNCLSLVRGAVPADEGVVGRDDVIHDRGVLGRRIDINARDGAQQIGRVLRRVIEDRTAAPARPPESLE